MEITREAIGERREGGLVVTDSHETLVQCPFAVVLPFLSQPGLKAEMLRTLWAVVDSNPDEDEPLFI